jgi:hypothetical protein
VQSPLKLCCQFELRSWRDILDTTLCDKVCQWLATGRWFSPATPVSSINKSDLHDIAEILLKLSLNTINHKSTRPCCVLSWRVSNTYVIVVGLKPTIYHTRGEHVSFFLSLYISTNKGHPACKRKGAKTSYLKLSPWYILNIILCFIKFLYLC